ncbi:hypothetical protein [Blastococcus deserti]|uniref:ABM domain-containing protein n=1 Tax=Blastococcus deserti TaxID=2259033 RepID=A0ABW4XDY5_9ACTN
MTPSSLVRVSVTFLVARDSVAELRRAFTDNFAPAISAQQGFLECLLLAATEGGDAPRLRLDITFRTEDERLAWVQSDLHDKVFEPMAALASSWHVDHLVLA